MATYYVGNSGSSPAGTVGNDGLTSSSPKGFATGADLTTWLNTLVDGDIVWFKASPVPYFQTGWALQSINKALFLWADSYGPDDMSQDWYGDGLPVASRFTRTVVWDGHFRFGANCSMDGIRNQCSIWPTGGQTWADVGPANAAAGVIEIRNGATLTRTRCEMKFGYGPEGWAAFDTQRMYDEFRSPTWWTWGGLGIQEVPAGTPGAFPGWGNLAPATTNNNTISAMPSAFYITTSGGGGWDFADEYIHDVAYAFSGNSNGQNMKFKMTRVWVERFYWDAFQAPASNYVWGELRLHGCIVSSPFGHQNDAGNPHSDAFQSFSNNLTRLRNQKVTNCLIYNKTNDRASIQVGWLSAQQAAKEHAGVLFYKTIAIGGQKFLELGGPLSCLVDKCIGVIPADVGLNPVTLGGQTYVVNPGTAYVSGSAFQEVVTGASACVRNAASMVRDSILEAINFQGPMVRDNVALVGRCGSTIPLAQVFANPTAVRTTPASAFNAFKPIGQYADKGTGCATVRELLEAPLSLAGMKPFIGVAANLKCELNQPMETPPLFIHGGDEGDPIAFAPPAGVQWQLLDKDETTVLQAYTSAAGNLQAGKYARFKRTSSPSPSTTLTAPITLGGQTFTWSVRTKSNNDYPGANKPATFYWTLDNVRLRRAANGDAGGAQTNLAADTKHAIMWLDFSLPAGHGAAAGTYNFVSGSSNRTMRTQLTVVDATRFHFALAFTNSGSGTVATATFLNLTAGKRYRIGMSVDTSQPDASSAVIVGGYNVTDNAQLSSPAGGYTKDALIATTWTNAAGWPQFFMNLPIDVYAFWLEFDRSFQMLGLTPKPGWNYECDEIGPNGEGLWANPAHNWTGPHDMARSYAASDGVTYNGQSYVSLVDDNKGNLPTGAETDNAFWKHVRRKPMFFFTGQAGGAVNRGTGNALVAAGSGTLTDLNGKAWPPPLDLAQTLATAGKLNTGEPISIIVNATGYPQDVTLTPASDKAGAWSGSLLPLGASSVTLTFTPSAHGNHTVSVTNNKGYTNPANLTLPVGRVLPFTISPAAGYSGPPLATSVRIRP